MISLRYSYNDHSACHPVVRHFNKPKMASNRHIVTPLFLYGVCWRLCFTGAMSRLYKLIQCQSILLFAKLWPSYIFLVKDSWKTIFDTFWVVLQDQGIVDEFLPQVLFDALQSTFSVAGILTYSRIPLLVKPLDPASSYSTLLPIPQLFCISCIGIVAEHERPATRTDFALKPGVKKLHRPCWVRLDACPLTPL